MTKAILVLDEMPSCCRDCDLCTLYHNAILDESEYICFVTKESVEVELDNDSKLNNCPLKPAPSSLDWEFINETVTDNCEYYRCFGRQELIDEILGEEK